MNKELSVLSDILKVNVEFLTQIRGVLDVTKVRRMLIEKEYQDNVREKKYQKKQIIAALMKNTAYPKAVSNRSSMPKSATKRNTALYAAQL